MFRTVLIANRGEIARRIIRTCHEADVQTVAVHSDADADAPYVRDASFAVRLPGVSPADTYLRWDLIIEAAKRADADAVHPGYGFLSENPEFAREVIDAGLVWIGPPEEAIRAMASKTQAKELMREAGVPVLDRVDPEELTEDQFPILVKATAGGGGRGMRVVQRLEDLQAEMAAASREAASAFGDPAVFCEPYIERGRHIEVQILADDSGGVWSLGERECSIQRRHQKVIEEAPSPMVDDSMRHQLNRSARDAALAVGYVGAGTVEFIATESQQFYFLEMNTRLQVEHPVTECVTGLDLVYEQLRIAAGESLEAEPPPTTGHSIEVRLYAEDPNSDWAPQSGPIHRFHVPGVTAEFGSLSEPGIRLDSGIESGDVITTHYDAMLAKVISWDTTRGRATRRLAGALGQAEIHGPITNREMLVQVLRAPWFASGDIDTGLLEREITGPLGEPLAGVDAVWASALAASVAMDHAISRTGPLIGIPPAWRNVVSQPQHRTFAGGSGELHVRYRRDGSRLEVDGLGEVVVEEVSAHAVTLRIDDLRCAFSVAVYDHDVFIDSPMGPVQLELLPRFQDAGDVIERGSLTAPMPGVVVEVLVAEGESVTAGDVVVLLEAMKMEHPIEAPEDGVVRSLTVAAEHQVDKGAVLAVIDPADTPETNKEGQDG